MWHICIFIGIILCHKNQKILKPYLIKTHLIKEKYRHTMHETQSNTQHSNLFKKIHYKVHKSTIDYSRLQFKKYILVCHTLYQSYQNKTQE